MATATATYTGTKPGQTAIDRAGRELGTIESTSKRYVYLADGSRVAQHNLAHFPLNGAPTLFQYPDGTARFSTLEEWLAA